MLDEGCSNHRIKDRNLGVELNEDIDRAKVRINLKKSQVCAAKFAEKNLTYTAERENTAQSSRTRLEEPRQVNRLMRSPSYEITVQPSLDLRGTTKRTCVNENKMDFVINSKHNGTLKNDKPGLLLNSFRKLKIVNYSKRFPNAQDWAQNWVQPIQLEIETAYSIANMKKDVTTKFTVNILYVLNNLISTGTKHSRRFKRGSCSGHLWMTSVCL